MSASTPLSVDSICFAVDGDSDLGSQRIRLPAWASVAYRKPVIVLIDTDAGEWKLLCVNAFAETAQTLGTTSAAAPAALVVVDRPSSSSSSSSSSHVVLPPPVGQPPSAPLLQASVDARVLRPPPLLAPSVQLLRQLRHISAFAAPGAAQNAVVAEVVLSPGLRLPLGLLLLKLHQTLVFQDCHVLLGGGHSVHIKRLLPPPRTGDGVYRLTSATHLWPAPATVDATDTATDAAPVSDPFTAWEQGPSTPAPSTRPTSPLPESTPVPRGRTTPTGRPGSSGGGRAVKGSSTRTAPSPPPEATSAGQPTPSSSGRPAKQTPAGPGAGGSGRAPPRPQGSTSAGSNRRRAAPSAALTARFDLLDLPEE